MKVIPTQIHIYHITHINNLPSIIKDGGLWSDAKMIARGGPVASIGMSTIKQRRLSLPVKCYPQDCVGEYVPFYFCPRSIMLYLLHRGNHPELNYHGGQEPIIHLEADLYETVRWVESQGQRWAFTLSNAGAVYTEFRNRLDQLGEIDWTAVAAKNFHDEQIKEGKQAEFLVYSFFPWHLVRRIGVKSLRIKKRVLQVLTGSEYQPFVEIRPDWYF
ncbi:hypothetical protein Desku_1571 [Desulfofundulus kuznetsovii DSM 6115]|uniref:DarT domain-containing protein n=1 Tax=Desulfofundulus kuznetsovii (strain DSM 6115 / VKM B-1805 / 17) TaxID=760568 RepID=A0AAU8PB17_DESK7|nr:hypothetical protein Desku_1571 [Desulfofundulus kuznetsovii DSM 6115]